MTQLKNGCKIIKTLIYGTLIFLRREKNIVILSMIGNVKYYQF